MIKKLVAEMRKLFPRGTRVKLVEMNDFQAPPDGTCGTVYGVDDFASLLVHWDTGSSLNVIYGVDVVEKLAEEEEKLNKEENN